MVYTEYFAIGTEPTNICDLHLVPAVYGRIAGALGEDEKPAPPPRVDGSGPALPPTAIGTIGAGATPTVGTAGATGATGTNGTVSTGGTIVVPPRVDDPGTKRGFWSRVFGRGRGEPEKPQEPPPPPKKKGG